VAQALSLGQFEEIPEYHFQVDKMHMKHSIPAYLRVLAWVLAAAMCTPALADRDFHRDYGHYHDHGDYHGHGHVGIGFVFNPFWFGPQYYPPYYYPPAVVTVPATPPVYIERSDVQTAPPARSYWYYCENPQGYYPYIKQCPGGWQPVSPQPPSPPER
jgi:hypothetical protein